MPRAVVVSPHLDDAAFSCGGTLASLSRQDWDVVLCTVFTRSVADPTGFALACQLDKHLPADADYMAIRRREDAAACRHLGCQPLWLPFAEAPHRGYGDARALFGPLLPADDVAAPLADALAAVLSPAPDLVFGPQAIGGHVDHVQVVNALRRVLPRLVPSGRLSGGRVPGERVPGERMPGERMPGELAPRERAPGERASGERVAPPRTPPADAVPGGVPVLWWMDFPYALRPQTHPAQPFAAVMDRLPERAFPGDRSVRLRACKAYASQIGFQFGSVDGLEQVLAKADPVERMRLEGALPADAALGAAFGLQRAAVD